MKLTLIRLVASMVMVLFCSPAWADCNPCDHQWQHQTIPLESRPEFADVRAQLQAVVNAFGFHSINQFYIVTYPPGADDNVVIPFIYWPTQNKFIEWGTGPNPTIIGASHYFDVSRDIAAPNNYTSTYLVSRSVMRELIEDCLRRGEHFTITKTVNGWVPVSKFSAFSSIRDQLQFLVDNRLSDFMDGSVPIPKSVAISHKPNQFCVIGQQDDGFLAAYIFWKPAHQLFMWVPPEKNSWPVSVAYSFTQIDLNTGLRNHEDANDNRNEMQRSYALGILKACQSFGENFVISSVN